MRNSRILVLLIFVLAALSEVSCNDDSIGPGPGPDVKYKPPDGPRDNVLYNLQFSYNSRNIDQYDKLLDADFIFYFSYADVNSSEWAAGKYWDRAHEIMASRNLFNPAYSTPTREPASSIALSLTYAEGDDHWTPITPDPVKYPGETWYEKVATYNISVKSGTMTFMGIRKNASFVVRWAHVDGAGDFWRIVTWRDDTGTLNAARGGFDRAALVQDTSWGRVKSLYGE